MKVIDEILQIRKDLEDIGRRILKVNERFNRILDHTAPSKVHDARDSLIKALERVDCTIRMLDSIIEECNWLVREIPKG